MAAKVKYLVEKKNIDPGEIIVISYVLLYVPLAHKSRNLFCVEWFRGFHLCGFILNSN